MNSDIMLLNEIYNNSITAINAIFVGYIIFWDKLKKLSFQLVNIIKVYYS